MRLKMLSCDALAREVYLCAATSPHVVDIQFLKRGLHDTPDVLRAELQKLINEVGGDTYDAVCLGYALCGNSLLGLRGRHIPLVVPRGHDCITLYLGSRGLYQDEFTTHPGTYYYTLDFLERRDTNTNSVVPLGTTSDARRKEVYDEYVEKYGKDNADYLLEVMGGWMAHYNRAAFIDMGIADSAGAEEQVRQEAQTKGWTFEKLAGKLILLRKLIRGDWDADFLVVPPNNQITVTYDDNVIGFEPCPPV